mmetsp:Transcript_8232/g.34560  ORF Transcript_8232/g.34560 Transcript_8232/m.34560 type:complete len:202 (-) Transcript_8232:252-857(-)
MGRVSGEEHWQSVENVEGERNNASGRLADCRPLVQCEYKNCHHEKDDECHADQRKILQHVLVPHGAERQLHKPYEEDQHGCPRGERAFVQPQYASGHGLDERSQENVEHDNEAHGVRQNHTLSKSTAMLAQSSKGQIHVSPVLGVLGGDDYHVHGRRAGDAHEEEDQTSKSKADQGEGERQREHSRTHHQVEETERCEENS